MAEIAAAVGKGRPNKSGDVSTVQALLNRNMLHLIPLRPLEVNGKSSSNLDLAIRTFQERVVKMKRPDGYVEPKSQTLVALAAQSSALPGNPVKTEATPSIGGLTEQEIVEAARRLKCEAAAIKAVVKTELGIRDPFDEKGRPTILFEPQWFSRLTNGKYEKSNPSVSNKLGRGGGLYSAQYAKLQEAEKLDRSAAYQSCSWGAFQIMNFNFNKAGFNTVFEFVDGNKISVHKQLSIFVTYVEAKPAILAAIRKKDWETFHIFIIGKTTNPIIIAQNSRNIIESLMARSQRPANRASQHRE